MTSKHPVQGLLKSGPNRLPGFVQSHVVLAGGHQKPLLLHALKVWRAGGLGGLATSAQLEPLSSAKKKMRFSEQISGSCKTSWQIRTKFVAPQRVAFSNASSRWPEPPALATNVVTLDLAGWWLQKEPHGLHGVQKEALFEGCAPRSWRGAAEASKPAGHAYMCNEVP